MTRLGTSKIINVKITIDEQELIYQVKRITMRQQMELAYALGTTDFNTANLQLNEQQIKRLFKAQIQILRENIIRTPDNLEVTEEYLEELDPRVFEALLNAIIPQVEDIKKK